MASASNDETVMIWDASTGAPIGSPLRVFRDVLVVEKDVQTSAIHSPCRYESKVNEFLFAFSVKVGGECKIDKSEFKTHAKVFFEVFYALSTCTFDDHLHV